MKKAVICSSGSLYQEASEWKKKLENLGYSVLKSPDFIEENNLLKKYPKIYADHYNSIKESDILFILNLEKNGFSGYIGAGVFAEIAFAIGLNISLNKKIEIYFLNPIPINLPYSKELKLWEQLKWIMPWNDNFSKAIS